MRDLNFAVGARVISVVLGLLLLLLLLLASEAIALAMNELLKLKSF